MLDSEDEDILEDGSSSISRLNAFKYAGPAASTPAAAGLSEEDLENATVIATFPLPEDPTLLPVPSNYAEAHASTESQEWDDAIMSEWRSHQENQTWEVVQKKDIPPGRKPLTVRLVYRRKIGKDGKVSKYKVRLVARGFQQREGFDFTETYSGVVKTAAYRTIFALMAALGWKCHQMDFVTAFLNGGLEEVIHMRLPPGLPCTMNGEEVFVRLLKGLYGLKQSLRVWYRALREWLLAHGWQVSQFDECVFYYKDRALLMPVYVDDINIFGKDEQAIVAFKKELLASFRLTDEGEVAYYLGMQVVHTPDGLHIHQGNHIKQMLRKYGLDIGYTRGTPLDPTKDLIEETEKTASADFKHLYLAKVGTLNYFACKTRADITSAVSIAVCF
ncbi:hypothetical protein CBER1_07278 [Cercospora berteroae]|uniref:Reverse transcriptase Ty1/copia-type domain-containing protein n=1 Tax=Cercospora berteroae TaxID=357750 RepID=A0A2S6BTL3_9PEZI|nr:hypothetical protein CBER1_07278 [Cercospora berteroae]